MQLVVLSSSRFIIMSPSFPSTRGSGGRERGVQEEFYANVSIAVGKKNCKSSIITPIM